MIVIRTYNNNVALVSKQGKEVIVVGSGVGFQKKRNDRIDEEKIEKIYVLDQNEKDKLELLSTQSSLEYFELASSIFQNAQEVFSCQFSNQMLIGLLDHITFAIKRNENGIILPNLILDEIKWLYPDVYEFSKQSLVMINEETKISLPDDEIGYIAMHVIANLNENSKFDALEVIEISKEIMAIIVKHFDSIQDQHSYAYQRLLMHLKYFAQRVLKKETQNNLIELNKEMYSIMIQQNHRTPICLEAIHNYLELEYEYLLSPQEEFYIMVHLMQVTT